MKQKIISVLMAMVVLLTTVDLSVFASEATVSGNEVQSVIEEVNDDVETTTMKLIIVILLRIWEKQRMIYQRM